MAPLRATRPRRRPAKRANPQRTCIGCRRRASPDDLVRLAWSEGTVQIGRQVFGRGAWLCASTVECFDIAIARKALTRALRIELSDQQKLELRARLHGIDLTGDPPDGKVPFGNE